METNNQALKGTKNILGSVVMSIRINIHHEITGNFSSYVLSNPMYMHEYGHTFDSRIWGLSYLFTVGLPSLISADKANRTNNSAYHREKWYERSASRKAKKYFNKYGVIWNDNENPTW